VEQGAVNAVFLQDELQFLGRASSICPVAQARSFSQGIT
jgi:hypothetical protein